MEDKINCEKHGETNFMEFIKDFKTIKKVCFECYTEKVTDGLKNYD